MHPFNNSDGTIKRHDKHTVKIDDKISINDSNSIFEIIATLMKSKFKLNQTINQTNMQSLGTIQRKIHTKVTNTQMKCELKIGLVSGKW